MSPVQRFVAGVAALPPFPRIGKLVTIGLCLLVGVRALASCVENAGALFSERELLVGEALRSGAVLGVCLLVVAVLFGTIVRTGEARQHG